MPDTTPTLSFLASPNASHPTFVAGEPEEENLGPLEATAGTPMPEVVESPQR